MSDSSTKVLRARVMAALELPVSDAANAIRAILASLGDPHDVEGARRFIPGVSGCFGVRMPLLRVIARELARWGVRCPATAISLLEALWQNDSREERVIAAKVLERLGTSAWEPVLEAADRLVRTIHTWEECDQLGCFGLRFVIQCHPERVTRRCVEWVGDPNPWIRRFGVVVLTSLSKTTGYRVGDRELSLLDRAIADEAREVQDAVSWTLREMAAGDPAAIAAYVRRHATSRSKATRRIISQALKALPEGDRASIRAALGHRMERQPVTIPPGGWSQ